MNNGWIKLHRKLTQTVFYRKPAYLALWVHLLLSVNHEEGEFMWNGAVIKVKPGQFVTGRKQLSDQIGLALSSVEDILTFLEKIGKIRQQKTTKYRLITILKWDEYQNSDNKPTTSRQQADTNKNDKNNKNHQSMSFKNMKRYKGEEGGYEEVTIQTDPDFVPRGKEKKKVADDIQQVFDLFDNPAKAIWRLREIERDAAKTLYETYGIDTLQKRMKRIELEKTKKDPYFPHVDSPSELLDKMGKIERYLGI